MVVDLLVRGFWIGLAISVPVGPVGVMIIRRTLAEGLPAGVLAGLGSATGMALYGSIAGFGLTAISGFLVSQQRPLKLLGGLLLLSLGFSIARAAPPLATEAARRGNLAGAFATTFVLTAISPAVLIYFLALFANVGLLRPGGELMFLQNSTISMLCTPDQEEEVPLENRLERPQFGLFSMSWEDHSTEFHLSHGEQLRLLRDSGFEVLDLIEIRPPADATTTYRWASLDWARQWPIEEAWKARKR